MPSPPFLKHTARTFSSSSSMVANITHANAVAGRAGLLRVAWLIS